MNNSLFFERLKRLPLGGIYQLPNIFQINRKRLVTLHQLGNTLEVCLYFTLTTLFC